MRLIYAPPVTAVTSSLSLTDWVVLGLVAESPAHGFAVARALEADAQLGQVWTVRRSLVYRALDHLEAARLVEPARTERGEQGPHRTVYRATRRGRARLARWLDEPVNHPREFRAELLVKFILLARGNRPLAPLAMRQRARFAVMVDGLAANARDASGADRVVARWRVESVEAISRTLDAVVSEE